MKGTVLTLKRLSARHLACRASRLRADSSDCAWKPLRVGLGGKAHCDKKIHEHQGIDESCPIYLKLRCGHISSASEEV